MSCNTVNDSYKDVSGNNSENNQNTAVGAGNTEENIKFTDSNSISDFPESVWNMTPDEEYIYFTGISPYYLDSKKSDEILLKDAAQSAAVYDNVFAFSGLIKEKSSMGTRTGVSFNYIYDQSSFEYYYDNLESVYSHNKADSIYRVFRIKKYYNLPKIPVSVENKEPDWIYSMPVAKGYSFSIGVSGRYSRISDSVRNADSSALEEMIKQKNITVYTDSGYNYSDSSGFEYAGSNLKGFYIIRRWWRGDKFYSLGIMKDSVK